MEKVPGSPYAGPPLSWRPRPPRPARRRRSELAVPGSNPRMMQGAAESDADAGDEQGDGDRGAQQALFAGDVEERRSGGGLHKVCSAKTMMLWCL